MAQQPRWTIDQVRKYQELDFRYGKGNELQFLQHGLPIDNDHAMWLQESERQKATPGPGYGFPAGTSAYTHSSNSQAPTAPAYQGQTSPATSFSSLHTGYSPPSQAYVTPAQAFQSPPLQASPPAQGFYPPPSEGNANSPPLDQRTTRQPAPSVAMRTPVSFRLSILGPAPDGVEALLISFSS